MNDHHIGQMVKRIVKKRFLQHYYDQEERWDQSEVSMSEKRILLTKWLAEAWETVMKDKHDAVKLAFKRCGALNNIDGSEDNEIT